MLDMEAQFLKSIGLDLRAGHNNSKYMISLFIIQNKNSLKLNNDS